MSRSIKSEYAVAEAGAPIQVVVHSHRAEGDADHAVAIGAGMGERLNSSLFGSRRPDSVVVALREGLPLSTFEQLRTRLDLSEAQLVALLGLAPRTFARRKAQGQPLDPATSDRLYRLAKLEARAVEVFDDPATALDWLKRPNRALGETPLHLLDTEAGADMVERVLTRIEHGVYS